MVSVRVSYSNSVSATSLKGIIDFFNVLNADMPMHWLASPLLTQSGLCWNTLFNVQTHHVPRSVCPSPVIYIPENRSVEILRLSVFLLLFEAVGSYRLSKNQEIRDK